MPQRPSKKPDQNGAEHAARFGALIRERREALQITQDNLALTTGVGRRFILELEAGKPSCQLGKALLVAIAVGLRPFDLISQTNDDNALLPDLADDREESPNG
jgi:transcriptional regulator with XRE-family HTH domain